MHCQSSGVNDNGRKIHMSDPNAPRPVFYSDVYNAAYAASQRDGTPMQPVPSAHQLSEEYTKAREAYDRSRGLEGSLKSQGGGDAQRPRNPRRPPGDQRVDRRARRLHRQRAGPMSRTADERKAAEVEAAWAEHRSQRPRTLTEALQAVDQAANGAEQHWLPPVQDEAVANWGAAWRANHTSEEGRAR